MFLASRIVSLSGASGLFLASFFNWYWGEGGGIRRYENAWQNAESITAVILMLVAMTLLAVGWAWRSGWLAMGILELILTIVCFGLTIFFILHNKEPVIVFGRSIPSGVGVGAWIGLLSCVVMIVGTILNLSSGGPFPREEDEVYAEFDERDEWDEPPRRRGPRPVRRPPPRRRPGPFD